MYDRSLCASVDSSQIVVMVVDAQCAIGNQLGWHVWEHLAGRLVTRGGGPKTLRFMELVGEMDW